MGTEKVVFQYDLSKISCVITPSCMVSFKKLTHCTADEYIRLNAPNMILTHHSNLLDCLLRLFLLVFSLTQREKLTAKPNTGYFEE